LGSPILRSYGDPAAQSPKRCPTDAFDAQYLLDAFEGAALTTRDDGSRLLGTNARKGGELLLRGRIEVEDLLCLGWLCLGWLCLGRLCPGRALFGD